MKYNPVFGFMSATQMGGGEVKNADENSTSVTQGS